jgi:DNA/RNA endonuclease G (NUC1)
VNDIDTNTQIIAVMMPNNPKIEKTERWESFITTVRRIEETTGFNFYRNIEQEIQDIIENREYKIEKVKIIDTE